MPKKFEYINGYKRYCASRPLYVIMKNNSYFSKKGIGQMDEKIRCGWCEKDEIYRKYHDEEWGVPEHNDQKLYEHLMMENMQCGLNWLMMLKKREIFRKCFDGFDYKKIAGYGQEKIQEILGTEGMIRSRRKIEAVINNAQRYLEIIEKFGSFNEYLWRYTNGRTIIYCSHMAGEVCDKNSLSEEISRDLKARGFQFVGPVTIYSHLQACGLINDHILQCWRFDEINKLADIKYSH